jgi:acyl dehydratase
MVGESLYFFEDVEVGKEFVTPAMTVTQAHVALYGGLCGTGAGAPHAVQDLLPLCLSSGLGWRIPQPPLVILAFMAFEWNFLKPSLVGDTIRCASKTLAKRTIKEGGVVIEDRRILNQRDETIQAGKITLLVARRPSA